MAAERLEQAKALQERTKKFAIRIVRAFARLKKDEAARVIGRQLLRSGTSVAANYRAACRARSTADFIAKINIVLEEADETLFWLELLVEAELVKFSMVADIQSECLELVRIFAASLATAKANR
jgi:four helix bundle protein